MPRKSRELHELHGTEPRYTERPSEFAAGKPKCPRHLSELARKEWRKLIVLLLARGTVTPGDELLLAQAAELAARWQEAKADVARRGAVLVSSVLDSNGQPQAREKKNPYLTVAQESERALLAVLVQLGLSPLQREKVKVAKGGGQKECAPGTVGWMLREGGAK